ELALEFLVLADVGGNHLADLARAQQQPEAEAVDAGVVGDHRQALDPGIPQRGDQRLGDAAEAETADREGLVVRDDAAEGFAGVLVEAGCSHFEFPGGRTPSLARRVVIWPPGLSGRARMLGHAVNPAP